tara:strand:+ start:458 stop:634 length:177 start_codon:yes stop_codon:yes gene_type:complete
MNQNFENWQEELLSVDSSENHRQTLDEIEMAILESPAADNCAFRLQVFWLLRHFKKLL